MTAPSGWQNPITVPPGQIQTGIDPAILLPSRRRLERVRLEDQRALLLSGTVRTTPILVTTGGVIWDGHHAVRAAAEEGRMIDVEVIALPAKAVASSILSLPVR
jgi:hypothetical protein